MPDPISKAWTFEHELGYCASVLQNRGGAYVPARAVVSYLECQAVNGPPAFLEAVAKLPDWEAAAMVLRQASADDGAFQAGIDEFDRQQADSLPLPNAAYAFVVADNADFEVKEP